MELLIKNTTAVSMDDANPVVERCYIGVNQGKICWFSQQPPEEPADRTIDGAGKLALPGLVNAHTHLPMTLLRGYADDYALQEWLNDHIFPAEAKLDARCVRVGAALGVAECLRFGVTSVTDMYFQLPTIAEVCFQAGIKANLCNAGMSFDPAHYDFETANETRETREALTNWHMADGGRIRIEAGVHAEYTSFPALWRAEADFAQEHGLQMHLHLSETQKEHQECLARWDKTPTQVLAEYGVFDARTTAAHSVWLTQPDMELLAEKGAAVAHNPVSNLKLASGVAPVTKRLEKGVVVALGTDGMASNNNHDLFEEIKLCAILQKGISGDPQALPAWQALRCATQGGAYAQGRETECGALRLGMDADLILLDASVPSMQPMHNPISSLCYSASGRDVRLTMVRGKILYENGEFYTIDLEKVLYEAKTYALPRILGK